MYNSNVRAIVHLAQLQGGMTLTYLFPQGKLEQILIPQN